jgi:hypothetical protein
MLSRSAVQLDTSRSFTSPRLASRNGFTPDQIEKFAFDLGGIAHVVVEPNRAFSFQLRDRTAGANAYRGTLAIALPGRGIVRRAYLGFRLPDVDDLLTFVHQATIGIRNQMPAEGWDWTRNKRCVDSANVIATV